MGLLRRDGLTLTLVDMVLGLLRCPNQYKGLHHRTGHLFEDDGGRYCCLCGARRWWHF